MKVVANMFSTGLPILVIYLYSNYFEFIFKNGILVSDPIFYMAIPILPKKRRRGRREN